MTAWSILATNSTAPIGSIAWVHLNNQAGGGGVIILGGERSINITHSLSSNIACSLSTDLSGMLLTVDKPTSLSVSMERTMEATICQ